MSDALRTVALSDRRLASKKERETTPPAELRALVRLRAEARRYGATLATGGKGGLPASLVLGVMRRDEYRCKMCGTASDLTVHHKAGLDNPSSRWLQKKGHRNDPNNLVTLCVADHDRVHEKDRDNG